MLNFAEEVGASIERRSGDRLGHGRIWPAHRPGGRRSLYWLRDRSATRRRARAWPPLDEGHNDPTAF